MHPAYGPPLSGAPYAVDDVTFRPYRTGVMQYARIDDSHRIQIWTEHSRRSAAGTYYMRVEREPGGDVEVLAGRFRKRETAARAGIAALKRPADPDRVVVRRI